MAIEVKHNESGTVQLAIRDEMTIYSVLTLKQQLSVYFNSARELQIDLGDVSELDGAGVQLLLFLKQESSRRDIKLTLCEHSNAVVEVFELLNLGQHFGDPIVISANWKPA